MFILSLLVTLPVQSKAYIHSLYPNSTNYKTIATNKNQSKSNNIDKSLFDISGSCGMYLTFNIKDNVLIIQGNGGMYNYADNDQPWDKDLIKFIDVQNNVLSIGSYSFAHCTNLLTVTLPNSLESIGYHSFNGCSQLQNITIPEKVVIIPA